ncbi:MAG: hypothetical protein ABIN89_07545 [Chitinophagaceae bacterium]
MHKNKISFYLYLLLNLFSLNSVSITHSPKPGNILIENENVKYAITNSGKNISFIDKKNKKEYLFSDTVSYCASIIQKGKIVTVTSVVSKNNLLHLTFGTSGVTATLQVTKSMDRIYFKVLSLKGKAESLNFVNIPLTLKGMPDEPFATCVLAMNLFTNVIQLPALQTHLWASCYKAHGIEGAEIAMLGVPQKKILPLIRDVMKNAKEIPFSDKGGAWAQLQKAGYGSYLMNFGSLTEETVDDWIEMVHSLGFNQVDNHGGSQFFKFGDFEPNRTKWPEGWETFKKINERLHAAGISSIFHTYTFFIDKKSKYVTPIPSRDLAYFSSFTLQEPISANDSEIIVNESTTNISTITGFFVRNSITLRIGDELVEFSGASKSAPYKFTGCKRGVHDTKAAKHNADEKAFHLKELWGLFAPGGETPLFQEIARRTAEIVDKYKFDGIYFDAIDGPGMYLEFYSLKDCKLYGSKGEFLQDVIINGKVPVVEKGNNTISFNCSATSGLSSRAEVTIIDEGKPL